jgi:hypothetical protein
MSLYAPPSPHEELDELCVLLGSQGAVARYLGRQPTLIWRWRRQPALRPQTVELIDEAWNVAHSLIEVVGRERLPDAVHQRWPSLGGRTPSQLIREHKGDEALAAIGGVATKRREAGAEDADDEAIADWLANVLMSAPAVAALSDSEEEEEEEEPDEPLERSEWLSTAWRGGGTMSSQRWLGHE